MTAINLDTRASKIEFLQRLQKGKASIQDIMSMVFETWNHYEDEPDIYVNGDTGEEISATEMAQREKPRPNRLFEIRTYITRHEE
ncbi:MAG: hypothetical protein WKF97_13940 [Chitinophagaceae bacterium]